MTIINQYKRLPRAFSLVFILAALGLLIPSIGVASDNLQFSGFASIGAGKLDRSDLPFMDYDDEWSFDTDSILAGQVQYQISNRWSGTVQVIARGFTFNDNDNYKPVLEWLFLSYQWSAETRWRFGRLRSPLYLLSDSLEIGYSYPWARPPVDTYSYLLTAISNFDGLDFSSNIEVNDSLDLDLQLFAGVADGKYIDFDIHIEPMAGMNLVANWDNITARYGLTMANTDASSASLDPLVNGFNTFASATNLPVFAEIADSHSTENEWFQYHNLGLQWDIDNFSIIAEAYAIVGPGKDFSNDAKGWYLSFSQQIGSVAPYIVFGYYKNEFSDDIETLIHESYEIIAENAVGILPPANQTALDALRATDLAVVDNFNEKGRTYTAGIRYDFHPQADIKLEFQYFDSTALLTRTTEAHEDKESLLTTIVMDVVF
ncbi:hypothetical protein A9Q99_22650 [Gammaproteobacteria bacterium 45_16_T64]|nr:hypothetical protein A9Q99_22650 [Gammaproteobacteria bacterium 45_16_T64]